MTNDTNTSLDTTELERRLQSNNGDEEEEELDDVENGDVTAEKGNGSKRATSTKPSQYIIECLNCNKEFDSSQLNCSVELALCSLCYAESSKNNFPDYGNDVSGLQQSGESSKTDGEGDDENRKDNDDLDNYSNDNRLHKESEILNNGLQTKDDDDDYVNAKLPVHQDLYEQNDIKGYTYVSNAEDL